MDRLGFWGAAGRGHCAGGRDISVSADGSTWFLGATARAPRQAGRPDFSIR